MHSPSAELNAYILDFKAQKTAGGPHVRMNRSVSNNTISLNKSWLQDVLTMPSSKGGLIKPFCKKMPVPERLETKDSSVKKWLDEIDDKIAKRFPLHTDNHTRKSSDYLSRKQYNQDPKDHVSTHSSDESNGTLELILADPETGILDNLSHCASFDSHPNMAMMKGNDTCDICNHSARAPQWLEEVINEEICQSCLAKEKELNKSSATCKKATDCSSSGSNTGTPSKINFQKSDKKAGITPETNRIMNLIQHAIGQLREVKTAVEENTVSTMTSELSQTSQFLSEIPTDYSYT